MSQEGLKQVAQRVLELTAKGSNKELLCISIKELKLKINDEIEASGTLEVEKQVVQALG